MPAIMWVRKNIGKVKGRAAKFQRYSPYDMEDFIQQAYIAALAADRVSQERGVPFEACFWVLFSADIRVMASNPVTRNYFQEFREEYGEDGLSPTVLREIHHHSDMEDVEMESPRKTKMLIRKALHAMTPRQRQVWRHLLSKRHYSVTKIAGKMRVRRQVIEELRDTGLKRVRRSFRGKL